MMVQQTTGYYKSIVIIGALAIQTPNIMNVEQVVIVYLIVKKMRIALIQFIGNKDILHGMVINTTKKNVTITQLTVRKCVEDV
jgi:hypothetical protein